MPILKTLRSAFRRSLELISIYGIQPLILRAARERRNEPEMPISVHMLVSSKTWKMGLMAAYSFEYFSGRRWPFLIHDDGTLDEAIQKQIREGFPGCRIVTRAEAEALESERLKNYPACRRNRSTFNLSLKFFDLPAFAPHPRFIVLDSDLLFYKRPDEILKWADSDSSECWFNHDSKEGYASPGTAIEKAVNIKLWDRVNSGLCLLHQDAISLDRSERCLLALENWVRTPALLEQTLFALNASDFNRGGLLPRTYEISVTQFRHPKAIARHYISTNKWTMLYLEGPPSLLWLTIIKPFLWR